MINELVKIELSELKSDLKKGDNIIEEVSPSGKVIRHSEKVGNARISFMNLIQGLITSEALTPIEGTKALNLFGKKTTSLYWVKD